MSPLRGVAAAIAALVAAAPASSAGGSGTIATYAGGDGAGSALQIDQTPVAIAASGTTLYVADSHYNAIRAIDTTTDRETVVATGFEELSGLAVGANGVLFAADVLGLWRVDPASGTRTRISRYTSRWLAADGTGNVYASDLTAGNTVEQIASSGAVARFAGAGGDPSTTLLGDGGPAAKAGLDAPGALLAAPDGSLYIVDGLDARVREVNPSGTISTVAGGGTGDGTSGPATGAKLQFMRSVARCTPHVGCDYLTIVLGSLALEADGSLYIAQTVGANRIFKVDPSGTISVVADLGGTAGSLSAIAAVGQDLWLADGRAIERLTPDGHIQLEGGTTGAGGGDGGPAVDVQLVPESVAVGSDGTVYVTSEGSLRKIDATGTIGTVALPRGFAADLEAAGPGALYVADAVLGKVIAVGADGSEKALAAFPAGIDAMTADPHGNVYVIAGRPVSVRRIDPAGRVTVVLRSSLGNLKREYGVGVDGPRFSDPGMVEGGLAVTGSGTVFIAWSHVIWRLDAHGCVTRFGGTRGKQGYGGYGGDGGPAKKAVFANLHGLALDAAGDLYVADSSNSRIRVISPSGRVSTVAGDGRLGFAGDGGPATSAQLEFPQSVALDGHGHLYIADPGGNIADLSGGRLRVVSLG
jgi:sugar lactone lactonase YvrE